VVDKENSQSFGNALNEERSESELLADKAALNIMHDKRVFRGNTNGMNILKPDNLTPAQRDELRIKAERERLKFEMIKNQLIEFKKSKNKISPYELRPGPPARIEVDLT
jgi:hypothetical protein